MRHNAMRRDLSVVVGALKIVVSLSRSVAFPSIDYMLSGILIEPSGCPAANVKVSSILRAIVKPVVSCSL